MISSTSSPEGNPRPGAVVSFGPSALRSSALRRDRISTESVGVLKAELARQPEIRPSVVARGRALAADPAYPPPEVISRLAQCILAAPDLTAEEA